MIPYKHEPLEQPTEQIRILKLRRGRDDDTLICSLSVAYLASKPSYEALSYTWGDDKNQKSISITSGSQSSTFEVTPNLFNALRRLRLLQADRDLWIDAICIDQENTDEKGAQIPLMPDIYASAEKVLIYLGEKNEDSEDSINLVQRIVAAVTSTPNPPPRRGAEWIQYHRLPTVGQAHLWEPLKEFIRLAWFRRKWCIQETVVASNLKVIWGDWVTDWNDMEKLVDAIYEHGLSVTDFTTYRSVKKRQDLQQGCAQLHRLVQTKRAWRLNNRTHILDLLYQYQIARAKVRKDHLFALLGIAGGLDGVQPMIRYEKDLVTVLEHYARSIITKYKNLDVLYFAGLQGHRLMAPSWIPNWYGEHTGFGFEYSEGIWNVSRRRGLSLNCNIAVDSELQLVNQSPRSLGLKGSRVDSIRRLANESMQAFDDDRASKNDFIQFKRDHLRESDNIMEKITGYFTTEDPGEVQWRTLICNVTVDLADAPAEYAYSYGAWRRTLNLGNLEGDATEWSDQEPFRRSFDAHSVGKVFGSTAKGYVGMFPRSSQIEDEIYVLYGGDFPFVLRKLEGNDQFQLVGQCYLHGLMDGRFDWHKDSKDVYLSGPFGKAEEVDKTTQQ